MCRENSACPVLETWLIFFEHKCMFLFDAIVEESALFVAVKSVF